MLKNSSIILMAIIALYSTGTLQRNYAWKDEYVLYLDAANKSPEKSRPHNNLGLAYYKQGSLAEAAEEFKITIKLKPDDAAASKNLENIKARQK